jgi:hypothetical protein
MKVCVATSKNIIFVIQAFIKINFNACNLAQHK